MEAAWHPLPRLRDVAPDVPEGLAAVVDCVTSFEAGARYVTAAAMWTGLAGMLRCLPGV